MESLSFAEMRQLLAEQLADYCTREAALTRREEKLMTMMFQGLGVPDQARLLKTSEQTVKNMRGRLFKKLGVENSTQVIGDAYHFGGLQLWTYTGDPQKQIWRPDTPPEPLPPPPKYLDTAAERRAWFKRQVGLRTQRATAGT